MARQKMTTYDTPAEMKNFEIVDANVSKKYVPIYSSEVITLLEPEFQFEEATRFGGSSAHYFDMVTKAGDKLRMYNSYDRSLALSVSLISDGFVIPLGVDRLVHIGAKAKTFTEDFTAAKGDILKAVQTAKIVDTFLTTTDVTPEMATKIDKAIFLLAKTKEAVEVKTPVQTLVPVGVTLKEYIKKSVTNFLKGEYQYTNKSGKTLKGPLNRSVTQRIRTENRIIGLLKEEHPEVFL